MPINHAIELWKSQIFRYEKIIAKCMKQVTKSLTRFYPSDFQEHVQQFKELLQNIDGAQLTSDYLDVIVDFIQGKTNQTMISLADSLMRQFGGKLQYWKNTILDIADNVVYGPQLTIWQIKKQFEGKLFVDAANLSDFRQFTRIVRNYMNSLRNLIKSIMKFDQKKDTLHKLDSLYKKVKHHEEKYVGFGQETNMFQKSATIDDISNNMNDASKYNAKKTLFNYFQPKKTVSIQNTLLNYNFKITKTKNDFAEGPTRNIEVTQNLLTGQNLKEFQSAFQRISKSDHTAQSLREQFRKSKKSSKQKIDINYANIWDKDDYFTFTHFPVENYQEIQFDVPQKKYQFVEYDLQEEQLFFQLIGEDLDNQSSISSSSSASLGSFLVSDDHLSQDEQDQYKCIKCSAKQMFGEPWILNRETASDKFEKYQIVPLVKMIEGQVPLLSEEQIEEERILKQIVHGNDKKSIVKEINKKGLKISKAKVDGYLKKNCIKVQEKNEKNSEIKEIFKLIQQINDKLDEVQSERESKKIITINQSQEERSKEIQETTFFQEHEESVEFQKGRASDNSELSQRVVTRAFRKRESSSIL